MTKAFFDWVAACEGPYVITTHAASQISKM